MELFDSLALGFSVALSPSNVMYCLLGVTIGTLIGVLPGIGPAATIALLVPLTFNLDPTTSLIMLAGIYYGAQYGGSTTAILVNLPGETSAVVTCLDGHAMARQGRAGAALGIAALGSFMAGCVSTLVICLFAPPLVAVALKFGPAEFFSLMIVGLIAATVLAQGSVIKAIAMVLIGLILGLVGIDINSGAARFDFGVPELLDGLNFAVIAMGVFGIGEILANLHNPQRKELSSRDVKGVLPSLQDIRQSWKPIVRGTGLGSALGVLPGAGATLSSFVSYTVEKRIAADPSRFGKGAIEGVAGPEAANNAAAQVSFIPLLTLGIPSNSVMALMMGAMIIQGIAPGPMVMEQQPALFWGMIASMWVGNLLLVILNLPLIGIWVRLITVPYKILYPAILTFCCVGVYTLNYNPFDVFVAAAFGVMGYVLVKLNCEPAPMLLGFVLGPMLEENFRRAMLISRGDPSIFVTRPISLGLLTLAVGMILILFLAPALRRSRKIAFEE
jgi:TctA family transporter